MSAPLILAANTVVADDLRVENALNFMGATNTSSRFQRTNGADGSSTQATLSAWVKYQADVSQSVPIFMAPDAAGNDRFYINITSSEEIGGTHRNPDCDFSATNDEKFRDPAAWYHIVAAINTSDSTAADRLKIYVNNERITLTFATGGGLGSGANIHFNRSGFKNIFGYNDVTNEGVQNLTDMYFAEVIKCDGQVLTPSSFAEYDDDGIWVPKTGLEDSLTFGTTGYYFNFADSSDLGNDVSGNNNDASDVSNTTQSLDTPSNSFAVLNINHQNSTSQTFSEGNLKVTGTGSDSWTTHYGMSTYAVTSGKWYVEAKLVTKVTSHAILGIVSTTQNITSSLKDNGLVAVEASGRITGGGNNIETGLTAWSNGDIAAVAFDADNGTAQFYRNGSTYGSQVTSLASGEYYFSTNAFDAGAVVQLNFGNPQFSITSGNSDGEFGNFEHAPPSGYHALCTKNIAEYG
jgi:hypothetical protein